MHYHKVTSVDQWVFHLKTNPILAILSGFLPDDVPGVGLFMTFSIDFGLLRLLIYQIKRKEIEKAEKERKKESKT